MSNHRRDEATTDPRAAEQQRQIKADHDELAASARRVRSSVRDGTTTDPEAKAQQDQIKADHDELQEAARRVESSVTPTVRQRPIRESRPSDHR